MTINELLANSKSQFSLDVFSERSKAAVEADITEKGGKYYLKCLARGKDVVAKPEEIIPAIKRGIEQTRAGKPALLEFITAQETKASRY